ncbi:hypothetical protein NCM_02189 [Burkholderia pseudomallei]
MLFHDWNVLIARNRKKSVRFGVGCPRPTQPRTSTGPRRQVAPGFDFGQISSKSGKLLLHGADTTARCGLRYSGRASAAPLAIAAGAGSARHSGDTPAAQRRQIYYNRSTFSHANLSYPRPQPALPRSHRRRGRRADRPEHDRRDERLHRLRLSEGGAGRARRADRGFPRARRRFPHQRADGRVDRARAGRRAREGGRYLDAAAVPVRSDAAREDQRGRARLSGHPPEPRRAVRVVRPVRRAGRRDRRGRGHSRGRAPDSVGVGRQQQDVARPGQARNPRGERAPAARSRRDARHLLRHRAAAEPQADSAREERRPDRRAVSALPGREDRRDRRDRRAGPQQRVRRAGRDLQADRRTPDRFPASRDQARPSARTPAAAAVRRRQHHERGARRPRRRRFLEPERVLRK